MLYLYADDLRGLRERYVLDRLVQLLAGWLLYGNLLRNNSSSDARAHSGTDTHANNSSSDAGAHSGSNTHANHSSSDAHAHSGSDPGSDPGSDARSNDD